MLHKLPNDMLNNNHYQNLKKEKMIIQFLEFLKSNKSNKKKKKNKQKRRNINGWPLMSSTHQDNLYIRFSYERDAYETVCFARFQLLELLIQKLYKRITSFLESAGICEWLIQRLFDKKKKCAFFSLHKTDSAIECFLQREIRCAQFRPFIGPESLHIEKSTQKRTLGE